MPKDIKWLYPDEFFPPIREFIRLKKQEGVNIQADPELRELERETEYYFSLSDPLIYTINSNYMEFLYDLAIRKGATFPGQAQAENEPPPQSSAEETSSSDLMAFLKKVSGLDFQSLSAQEKAEILFNNRMNEEMHRLLASELRRNHHFLNDIVLNSAQAAKQLLGSRMGYYLSNQTIATMLFNHRDKIVPVQFADPKMPTASELQKYKVEIDNLLTKTKRNLTTLLFDPECYGILKQSGRFQAIKILLAQQGERKNFTPKAAAAAAPPPVPQKPKQREAWDPGIDSINEMQDRQQKQDARDLDKAIREGIDYYSIIGLNNNASEDEIRKACRQKKGEILKSDAQDKGAKMNQVNDAEKFLLNRSFKQMYDNALKRRGVQRP